MKKRILSVLLLLSLLLGGCSVEYVPATTAPAVSAPVTPALSEDGERLLVHFIDVGQADCSLIEYGDFHMIIDGGNRDDGQKVVSYLLEQGIEELDIVVSTHPHEDHVGGLPAVLAVFPVTEAIYSPTVTYSSAVFTDFMYYVDQQGKEITNPCPGEKVEIDENLSFTILGPVQSYEDTNNTSIVLRLDYKETSFLFTGDMERSAEEDILDYGMDVDVDVLKVGHHGSATSTSYRFLYEATPYYAVIPVGKDNEYGHPHAEPLTRLRDAGCAIFRTDEQGTITAISDGYEITFLWENMKSKPQNTQEAADTLFIGNKNSLTFHASDCGNLPSEKNRVEFTAYEDAIAAGYTPCGSCLGG